MGSFELAHPKLKIGGQDRCEPIERSANGNTVILKYKEGGEVQVRLEGETAYDIDGNRLDTEALVVGTSPVYCVK